MPNLSIRISLFICVLIGLIQCFQPHEQFRELDLRQQIQNTQILLSLYKQKYEALKDLYLSKFGEEYQINQAIRSQQKHQKGQNQQFMHKTSHHKPASKSLLLKSFNSTAMYLPPMYLIENNNILHLQTYEVLQQFMGDVLVVQPNQITSLIGRKLNIGEIKEDNGKLIKNQYILGLSAQNIPSMWHRSYNLNEYQDWFIQFDNNQITFRNRKEFKTIQFNQTQKIIDLYSLNQYKLFFVTTHRYGVINVRSQSINDFVLLNSISKFNKTHQIFAVSSTKVDNVVYILLNSGEFLRYAHQKIISNQQIENLAQILHLPTSYSLNYLKQTKIQIFVVKFYLFITSNKAQSVSIFNSSHGKYHYWTNIHLQNSQNSTNSRFHIFHFKESIRMIHSSEGNSQFYELILPMKDESTHGGYLWKIIVVIVGVICFLFIKNRFIDKKQTNPTLPFDRKFKGLSTSNQNKYGNQLGNQTQSFREGQIQQFIKKNKTAVPIDQKQIKNMKDEKKKVK